MPGQIPPMEAPSCKPQVSKDLVPDNQGHPEKPCAHALMDQKQVGSIVVHPWGSALSWQVPQMIDQIGIWEIRWSGQYLEPFVTTLEPFLSSSCGVWWRFVLLGGATIIRATVAMRQCKSRGIYVNARTQGCGLLLYKGLERRQRLYVLPTHQHQDHGVT